MMCYDKLVHILWKGAAKVSFEEVGSDLKLERWYLAWGSVGLYLPHLIDYVTD